jgi:DNA-binding transcriptional MerR regulator
MKTPLDHNTEASLDWLTLDDLCDRTGESRRTVRFYILNGLLSAPVGLGPAARYPASHTLRLRVVRRLQDDGMQLSRIRVLLAEANEAMLEAWLSRPPSMTPPSMTPPSMSPPSGLRPSTPRWSEPSPRAQRPDEPHAASPQIDLPIEPSEGWRRSQWEHVVLEPGVELHLCRPAGTAVNRRIQKLLEFYRSLGR